MRRLAVLLATWCALLGALAGVASAHRPGDPPHQLHQMSIHDLRTVPINPDSITGHYAAGGFLPADVEQINRETERLLDIVTERGTRLK